MILSFPQTLFETLTYNWVPKDNKTTILLPILNKTFIPKSLLYFQLFHVDERVYVCSTEINAAKFEKRQTDQLKTFQKVFSNHVLEHQDTSLLVQAMLCTAANTSPVERGYTNL